MSAPVLVVGAGPTGLTMAAELARYGIPVRVVDRLAKPAAHSRAMVVHPRTLETFERMGVVTGFLAEGRVTQGISMFANGEETASVRFTRLSAETAYPFILMVDQHQTERLLAEHLLKQGGKVERGVELVALNETATGIEATLQSADGKTETATYSYVLGCDGSHSAVRHLTGIPFEGAAYPEAFYLADCTVEGPLEQNSLSFLLSNQGFVVVFPFKQAKKMRLIVVNESQFRPLGENPTLEEFQNFVAKVSNGKLTLSKPEWLTRFRLHHRAVPTFRKGRAFLAGDAAHIHSPAGGQGMNTGIQDAFNLAWKVAYVIKDQLPATALDTYEEERLPVAQALLKTTDRFFRLLAHDSPFIRSMLRFGAPTMLNTVAQITSVQRFATRFVTQLGISYTKPSLHCGIGRTRAAGARLAAGKRLPDSEMQFACSGDSVRLHQALAEEGGYTLLLFCLSYAPLSLLPGAEAWRVKVSQAIGQDMKLRLVVGKPAHGSEADTCLIDSGRSFAKHCRLKAPAMVLVRPDGYIGWSTGLD